MLMSRRMTCLTLIVCCVWLSCAAGYAAPAKPKVLNNFVSELLKAKVAASSRKTCEFTNPRDGWVFFSTTVDKIRSCSISVSLQRGVARETVILHREGKTAEAMRLLSAGSHKLEVSAEGKPSASLVVRAMPEVMFSYFHGRSTSPDGAPYRLSKLAVHGGDRLRLYHWDFLRKNMLQNVNVLCGYGEEGPNSPVMKQWRAEGRKQVPENRCFSKDPEKLYAKWSRLFRDPFDGVLIDEFIPPRHNFDQGVMDAIKRIHDNPELKGTFYAYIGLPYRVKAEESRLLMDTILPLGYKWVHECYLWEQPTEAKAKADLNQSLKRKMLDFRKAFPGSEKSCIICLSILEAWDRMPHVDFKVWLDMQINMLANDPAFEGIRGLCAYNSNVADPELIRWLSQLYRHYCIEGKTEMVSPRYGFSLMLDHIDDLDSAAGKTRWELSSAEPGSIRLKDTKKIAALFNKPGYLPRRGGYLLFKRSAKKPNLIRQEIRNLKPGSLYSLRMFTCDTDDLKTRQKHALSVNLKGVEVISQESRQEISQGDSLRKRIPCWNYHYRLFRATEEKASIEISDWAAPHTPGGPIGQELLLNFIQVQPFFEADGGE